ncbi:hypothetical protein N9Y41_01005 [Planktomarina temperata]|nr:hypothetical protein [Planktomarina temperata]
MFKKISEHLCLEKETMTIQQHASFDSSAAELNATSKLVKAWESKNAKNAAKAGGVSLMALSLAACGGSDSTTTAVVADPVTPVTPTGGKFSLTPLDDIASDTMALNGSLTSTFRFTDGNETVSGISATMASTDVLIDASATDNDVLNITGTGATAITTVNIETVNLNAASGTVVLQAATMTGVTDVVVSGAVAATVDDVASAATIKSSDYGRVLKVDATDYAGLVANKNADTVNLEVSGGTYGTTAATQTGFDLDVDTAATIEVLNITSSGAADNAYALTLDTNMSLSTVNFLGAANSTVRVEAADVSGLTLVGTAATGTTTLRVDTNSTSAALNATNFTGIDNFLMADSTVGSDNASISSLYSGATVTLGDDFGGENSVFTVKGATYTAPAASLNLVLDNETANDAVDAQQIDIQNITALNVTSSGNPSESTSIFNLIDDLVGDATSVTITGDTSLDLDANMDGKQTASGTDAARAVTVDASGMTGTAFLNFAAAANTKVSYTVTGTANADTIVTNGSGSTVTAGAGNDAITGGNGVDTIDAGAGKDDITASYGADKITLGDGVDTIDIDITDAAAVTEKQTITFEEANGGLNADATFAASVNGEVITWLNDVTAATSVTLAADELEAALVASTGYSNGDFTVSQASGVLTLTFDSDIGNVADIKFWEVGVDDVSSAVRAYSEADATTTTDTITITSADVSNYTGSLALDVDMSISDFSSSDVLDVAGVASLGANYFEGATADAADAANGVVVLTGASYATASAAEDAIAAGGTDTADAVVVYLNSTSGTAEMMYVANLGTNETSEEVLAVFENITTLADVASVFSADSFIIA